MGATGLGERGVELGDCAAEEGWGEGSFTVFYASPTFRPPSQVFFFGFEFVSVF